MANGIVIIDLALTLPKWGSRVPTDGKRGSLLP
jgi:hypothetical protein